MPEVGIGFFPDVGATWFLPRIPGELGTYCALTGERFGIADALAGGLATHGISSTRFDDLMDGLTGTVQVEEPTVRVTRSFRMRQAEEGRWVGRFPLQGTGLLPSLPGLDRAKMPTFLSVWQPELTMEKQSGK